LPGKFGNGDSKLLNGDGIETTIPSEIPTDIPEAAPTDGATIPTPVSEEPVTEDSTN